MATEMAARVVLLTYNLWNLFLRLLEPGRHVEAFQGRRWFLLIAARLVKSGGSRTVMISVADDWRRIVTDGYRRVCAWLACNCAAGAMGRRLARAPRTVLRPRPAVTRPLVA
jgi:hypothetical protein